MIALATHEEVHARLQAIFPEGTPNRAYITRMLAASTVFTALYVNAIEGSGTFLGPKHVYRMTGEQAAQVDDADRAAYATGVLRTGSRTEGRRRYQDNTREPIRDEALREGLVAIGAVTERTDLPTWRRPSARHRPSALAGTPGSGLRAAWRRAASHADYR